MEIENLLAAFEIWGILICSGIGIYFFLVTKINNRADLVMCIMQFVAAAALTYLARAGKVSRVIASFTYYFAAGSALTSIISAKYTHWYYIIDEQNVYQRQPYYNVALVLIAVLFVLVVLQIVVCAKRLLVKQIVSLLLYILIPFTMVILQVVFKPGIGLTNIGMAISLIIIFIVNNVKITIMES